MRVLTPPEIERLIKAAEGSDLQPVIALALATGIRRGEALALKWPAVDLAAGTITISENARFQPGEGVVYGTPKDHLVLEGIRYGLIEEMCASLG